MIIVRKCHPDMQMEKHKQVQFALIIKKQDMCLVLIKDSSGDGNHFLVYFESALSIGEDV